MGLVAAPAARLGGIQRTPARGNRGASVGQRQPDRDGRSRANPHHRWTALSYEALCRDPAATIRGLCEFAGIELDAALAQHVSVPLPTSTLHSDAAGAEKWRQNQGLVERVLPAVERTWDRIREDVMRLSNLMWAAAAGALLVGCASKAGGAVVDREVPLDASNMVAAQKAGYRMVNENGQTLYCKRRPKTGSHLRQETQCLTEEEWRDMQEAPPSAAWRP